MQPDEVSGTAEGACFVRACAARERDPSVRNPDSLAKHFLGRWYRALEATVPVGLSRRLFERGLPGGYAGHTARTWHCDRTLEAALAGGAEQVVVLGAGYDTRAYRTRAATAGLPIFEVDLPATQKRKTDCLRKLYGELPSHVTYVPIDFARQGLAEVLLPAGYDPTRRTHFNWEGVTYYIDESAIARVLAFVRDNAPRASTITFDYWLRSFVEGDRSSYGADKLVEYVTDLGEPFRFGLNEGEAEPFLRAHGFEVESDLGPSELSATYLRRSDGCTLAPIWGMIRMAFARTSPDRPR